MVSLTCQSILRRPAGGASKRLAYDIAKTAALSSEDWEAVYEGLRTDIAGAHSPEVDESCVCNQNQTCLLATDFRVSPCAVNATVTPGLESLLYGQSCCLSQIEQSEHSIHIL